MEPSGKHPPRFIINDMLAGAASDSDWEDDTIKFMADPPRGSEPCPEVNKERLQVPY